MIGETVGNFKVVARLGEGGMGEVYLAEQKTISTKVAIKALLPHVSANKEHVQRFFNEAIAVSRIKHSGIAKIFDVGFLPSGRAYLVMEFLDGETLASRIQRAGRLPLGQVGDIGRQIANVLEATHEARITHRDLKPDNIFLVPDAELDSKERVKILDFGIAKLGGTGMTGTSVGSMGTPGYMAPEQWHNSKAVDWRADAYSLGCVAFEMATGRVPFPAESIAEACTKHLTAMPEPLRAVVPTLPPALETLVARMLEKDAARRPATMKEITQTFAAIAAGQPHVLEATMMAPSAPIVRPSAPPQQTTLRGASGAFAGAAPTATPSRKGFVVAISVFGVLFAGLVIALVVFLQQRGGGGDDKQQQQPPATATREEAKPVPPPPVAVAEVAPPDAAPPPPAPPDAAPVATTPVVDAGVVAQAPRLSPTKQPAAKKTTSSHPAAPPPPDETPAPTPAPPAVPPSDLPEQIDRNMISAAIAAVKKHVRACLDNFQNADVHGVVKVRVTVDADGQITAVSVTQTPDAHLGQCVADAVRKATLPKTQRGGSFVMPFSL